MVIETSALIAAFQGASITLKDIMALSKNTAVNEKAIDLQNIIIGLQEKVLAMQSEILSLNSDKDELEKQLEENKEWELIKPTLKLKEVTKGLNLYATDEQPKRYFCPICFENKKKSPLSMQLEAGAKTRFKCYECKFDVLGFLSYNQW
jgi:hypothetical protein